MAVVTGVKGNQIIQPVLQLMAEIINKEDTHHILQFDLRLLQIIVQDIATLQDIAPPEFVKIWLQMLQNSLAEAKSLLDHLGRRQRCLDWLVNNPRRQPQQVRGWNAFSDRLYHLIQTDLSMWATSLHFLSSKPLLRKERVLLQGVAASGFVDGQPLSRDEAWMLFRRVAFKDVPVSIDIEERARIIADECRGRPLAINVVAASMIGQSSVEEWDNCLSSVKKVDPSFPPTHPHLDAELCRLLRWSYDSLPNSNVKNCFLYCSMYKQRQKIKSRQLVEMWIGEGLIKSKQGAYSMDMAIGRSYVKLLLHHSLFHIVNQSGTNVFRRGSRGHDVFPSIGVKDAIREMAMYIAQKEGNSLFMRGQNPRNLPEADYAKCRRISFPDNFSGALPTDLRCPNLTTLILQDNRFLELLPTELLLSRLTSLRVLSLSGCTKITSVPTSMGQLRLLQFLSLSRLPIRYLGEEVCHLSELQFLDLSRCEDLESLPSQIGQLKNLKHLNLDRCSSLKMIPPEICERTSLSRLQLFRPFLMLEKEAPASIWSLTGLQNLTELKVVLNDPLKDGIMGTWSEMRHLVLYHRWSPNTPEKLPDDMQNMKKLQTLFLSGCPMLSLPNCKFEHLETVKLYFCNHIRELSALESLPKLNVLKLGLCPALSELGIGSRVPSGYLRLEKLVLKYLYNLESVGGTSCTGVWDERTLPHLRVLRVRECPRLKRLPIGMEKLPSLCAIVGSQEWWESIMWEDPHMEFQLQKTSIL